MSDYTHLQRGHFFGTSRTILSSDGLSITDSTYKNFHECPWHDHENAHFAFTTGGSLTEIHKGCTHLLTPGSLLYTQSGEKHRNSNYSTSVSALHVDLSADWLDRMNVKFQTDSATIQLKDPAVTIYFYRLFKEIRTNKIPAPLVLESLVLQAVTHTCEQTIRRLRKPPHWVPRLEMYLRENLDETLTLGMVASTIDIHPVHLCAAFPRYFGSSFSRYLKKLRLQKAMEQILTNGRCNLAQVAYQSGFSDQSHFIRCLKKETGITPKAFRLLARLHVP